MEENGKCRCRPCPIHLYEVDAFMQVNRGTPIAKIEALYDENMKRINLPATVGPGVYFIAYVISKE